MSVLRSCVSLVGLALVIAGGCSDEKALKVLPVADQNSTSAGAGRSNVDAIRTDASVGGTGGAAPTIATTLADGGPIIDTAYESNCDDWETKLQDCGLLGEGRFYCNEGKGPRAECQNGCFIRASCDDLHSTVCDSANVGGLAECLDGCDAMHTCGDGSEILFSLTCNRVDDCEDGSDESDDVCKFFECDSGQLVRDFVVCDTVANCDDQSDEANCPRFECSSGQMVLAIFECDGDQDCPDNSDEIGCAPFLCD